MAKQTIILPIPPQELQEFKQLFDIRGVKTDFLNRFKSITWTKLSNALAKGRCAVDLLEYMRRYKSDNTHILQEQTA